MKGMTIIIPGHAPNKPRAIPRPPTGVTTLPYPVFDVVSEVSDTDIILALREQTNGNTRIVMNARISGEDVRARLIDRVVELVSRKVPDDSRVVIRCFTLELRALMKDRLDDRFIVADPLDLVPITGWADATREMLRGRLHDKSAERAAKRTVYAASDGSAHPTVGFGASAWVTNDGDWLVRRTSGGIFHAEMMAILSFARWFDKSDRYGTAVLFSDSLNAVRKIRSADRPMVSWDGASTAYNLVESGRLEVIWVRGHQGHLLNEVADSLAVMRHRAARHRDGAGIDVEQQGDLIVENALPRLQAIPWNPVKVRARNEWEQHVREMRALRDSRQPDAAAA